jgi:hypothetical protein
MIESARYTEYGSIIAVIDGVQMSVPDDMGNRHRQALAEWEAQGNAIEPYVEPPEPVPQVVSMFQARAALINAGLYDTVDAAMQQAGGVNLIAWEYATEVRRDSPLVQAMAAELGLTNEQVDNLFRQAAGIIA